MDEADALALSRITRYIAALQFDRVLADEVATTVYNILRQQYGITTSSEAFLDIIHKQVTSTYKEFAKTDPLTPRINLTLPDRRAMQYLEDIDKVYLGRFIEDPALKKAIVSYIREAYLENGAAIGNSPKELQAFINMFGEQLDMEKWRIRALIDTTVSKARVYGQVNGMRQAGVRTFEIAGPDDNLTCEYCKAMIGRKFSLSAEITNLDAIINEGVEGMAYVKPFLKGSMALEALAKASDAEVQGLGFALPPYHPLCRHRTIGYDFYENAEDIPYSMEVA